MAVAASAIVRVLVQRVTSARVLVDGNVVGQIRPASQGLVALVGLTHTDDAAVVRKMADKLWRLRILEGELSAADVCRDAKKIN
jgi:D-tyrosyl-tRNA(Tyr) deacylase